MEECPTGSEVCLEGKGNQELQGAAGSIPVPAGNSTSFALVVGQQSPTNDSSLTVLLLLDSAMGRSLLRQASQVFLKRKSSWAQLLMNSWKVFIT